MSVGSMQAWSSQRQNHSPKMPKEVRRGSGYNAKVVMGDGHGLARWESMFD